MWGKLKWSVGHTWFTSLKSMHMSQDLFFLGIRTGFANHSEWRTSLMNSATSSQSISSLVALCFDSEKQWRLYLTGFSPFIMLRECSTSFIGTPSMADGCHERMVQFSWRKLPSTISYFPQDWSWPGPSWTGPRDELGHSWHLCPTKKRV